MQKSICCSIVSFIFAIVFLVQWQISKTDDYLANDEKNISIVLFLAFLVSNIRILQKYKEQQKSTIIDEV